MKIENWGFWTWIAVFIGIGIVGFSIARIIAVSKMSGAEIAESKVIGDWNTGTKK